MTRAFNILGAIAGASLLFAGIGWAASLGITTSGLAAGKASVSGCVSSPLSATRAVDAGGNVTSVTVANVPGACLNQTLSVTLRGAGGSSLGSASTTIGSCSGTCSVTFPFTGIPASSLTGYAFEVNS